MMSVAAALFITVTFPLTMVDNSKPLVTDADARKLTC